MGIALCVVTLNRVSLLPADKVQNTFVIKDNTAGMSNIVDNASTVTNITDIWNTTAAGASATLGSRISGAISRAANAHRIDFYDITLSLGRTSLHGAPVKSVQWTLTPAVAGSDNVPAEVAAVATLFAVGRNAASVRSGGTRPKSTKTGRLYIGPLAAAPLAFTGNEVRFTSTFINDLKTIMNKFMTALQGQPGTPNWQVWSRSSSTTASVVGGRVDDAPDIQRRRGQVPSSSVTWGAAG